MSNKLKILMIASECVPFAKTGGLADVVGALPKALKKMGHDVAIVMPKYSSIDVDKYAMKRCVDSMGVWMGNCEEWCSVWETTIEGYVPVYFIECDKFFARSGFYHDSELNDYIDNPLRFSFLSRAGIQLCKAINFKPDVVHSHDWQSATASAYMKIWHWDNPFLGQAATVLTIHNVGYQGIYGKENYGYMGFGEQNYVPDIFEAHGEVNMLKGSIYYSDVVNTVSPTYAHEITQPGGGYGLAPYLSNKGDLFCGVLNGVDYEEWNPEIDNFIPANYSIKDMKGKSKCKAELQKAFSLEIDESIPVIGIVSRFAHQKGLDLLAEAIEPIINNMRVQFAILGSGDKDLEWYFGPLQGRFPGRVGSYIGYNNSLAHLVEAGSDMFLMPSVYEPCGLNQIYSLKYGTLPIVRATGGLDDTVEQYDEVSGDGTGFKFYNATASAIYYSVGWAVSTYYDRMHHFENMQKNAMQKHFSWDDSANEYVKLYNKAIEHKKSYS